MLQIPISAVTNQTLNVLLNNQNCKINLYFRNSNMYFDLYIQELPQILGVKCCQSPLIPYIYLTKLLGGNFAFVDNENADSYPIYTKFGKSQFLVFFTFSDV